MTSTPTTEAVVDLLNSRPYAIHADKLDDAELAKATLAPFEPDHGEITPPRLALIREFRAQLMSLVGQDPAENKDAWAAFSQLASAVTFRQDFSDPTQVQLRHVAGDPIVGGIVLAVAQLVTNGGWTRITTCANDVCQKVFYDTTRSRTRRWHSYEICGNRANVAAYRARTKH
jgi:predicted RNA-binding Zn ribbon-like protein